MTTWKRERVTLFGFRSNVPLEPGHKEFDLTHVRKPWREGIKFCCEGINFCAVEKLTFAVEKLNFAVEKLNYALWGN